MLNTASAKISLLALRLALGWMYFYGGLIKIINPDWSAAGFLNSAKSLPGFYHFLASPPVVSWIDPINQWALALLGLSLILGLLVRLSAPLGLVLMLLYYLPQLDFPQAGSSGFIVDQHIIYILLLLLFFFARAGRFWGLDGLLKRRRLAQQEQAINNNQ